MNHPARYSPEVITIIRDVLLARWPDLMPRPIVHDPFAGTFERLYTTFGLDPDSLFPWCGTEIEECFIDPDIPRGNGIMVGDSRDPATYPPARYPDEVGWGWVVCTSPVYANGMADGHLPRDESVRRTYRKAKIELSGDESATLQTGNMGALGYRGTKRFEDGGKSIKRRLYWEIAEACVRNWDTAELVIVNVSDFSSGGVMEPHVNDWKVLLDSFGWTRQVDHPVGTRRMRHGANSDIRADHEVVIVAEKG